MTEAVQPTESSTLGAESLAHTPRRRRPLRRLLIIVAATAVAAYIAVCVGIFLYQDKLLYFPSAECRRTPDQMGLTYENVTLTTDDGATLVAWFVPHAQPKGTILFCHGNAGNIAGRIETLKSFHQLGYNAMIFDYRGYGGSTGQPSEAGTYLDAETAWRWLIEQRGLSPDEIIVFGRSLGGAVAIELASRVEPAALVVECTFTSVVDIGQMEYPLLPVGLLCTNRYESVRKVPTLTCPKLFLHGTDDELIPLDNARALFAAAAEPKTFVETPGNHNDAGFEYDHETRATLARWLDCVLSRR